MANTFTPDIGEIMEEAYERAGLEFRTGYDIRTARRAMNIMSAEWSNRGLNLWTIDATTQLLTAGTASYSLGAGTIDIIDCALRTNSGSQSMQTDYTLNRISQNTYVSIPNKLTQARPLQFWVDRKLTPTVYLWPVPDNSQTYYLVMYSLVRMDDVAAGVDGSYDIPSRFLPAVIAGLAYYIAMRRPGVESRVPYLKQEYDLQFELAAGEDRERSSNRFIPYQGWGV